MVILYIYLENPQVHGVFVRETRTLYLSTNERSSRGVIYIKYKI